MLTVARWGLAMAFLLGLGAGVHAVRTWNFFRRGLRTDATVVAVERETRGAPPYAPYVNVTKVMVSFTDAQGHPVQARYEEAMFSDLARPGETIPVVYNPRPN